MEAHAMTDAAYPQPDRRRPEPLWYQVEQAIRAIVKSGEWATGDQIPAEDRLCAMFGVSRITLRHALRNLEEHGLLRREHGRGTFVRSTTLVAGTRELTSFTQEMGHLGVVVGSRLLDCSLTTANAATAAALEIEEGEPVVRIRRLRLGNEQPIGIQTATLSGARVPGFLDSGLLQGSLYEALEKRYGIVPVEAREVYRVAATGAEDADLLDLTAGSPAFVVERITTDERGPFELTHSIMRGDRYEIRATLRPSRPMPGERP
jgi:GntR family transcriptional regulator